MAIIRALFLLVAAVTTIAPAVAIARPGFSFGSSVRSGEGVCTKDHTRCAGAEGYPYVKYAPCCTDGYMCLEDEELGWGKWCVKPSKEQYGKCYLNEKRCMGAPGKPYIPYHKCCGGGGCVKDEKLGWGGFCKDGLYGDDYDVAELHKDYEVVDFKYEEMDKKEKKVAKKEEVKGYKVYVEDYEKEYYASKDKKEVIKHTQDKGYGYGGYGHIGKAMDKKKDVVDGKGGKLGGGLGGKLGGGGGGMIPKPNNDILKDILGPNGGNRFCPIPGEALALGSLQPAAAATGAVEATGTIVILSVTLCGATAATIPLRVVRLLESSYCASYLAAVPTGTCRIIGISDIVTSRMVKPDESSMISVVRQPGAQLPGQAAVQFTIQTTGPCALEGQAVSSSQAILSNVSVNRDACTVQASPER